MNELSWPARGRLWLRLGLRLGLALLLVPAARRLGPSLVSLLAPFLLAGLTAWGLSPSVGWLCRRLGLPRPLLSLLVLALSFGALGALVWLAAGAAVREAVSLSGDWEAVAASLDAAADKLGALFARGMARLPPPVRTAAGALPGRFFSWLEDAVPRLLSAALDRAADAARSLPAFAVAAVVFVMASYFLLADWPRHRAALADKLPHRLRTALSVVKRAVEAGFGGYLRAQLLLSAGVFGILLAGFLLVRQPYALLLALALAVLDLIPILGAGTVLVPWVLVQLLLGDGRRALGLAAVWGLVVLFRQVGEPKILGGQTGLSPLVSLVSVYAGMRLGGAAGMVLAPVLCLAARNICLSGVLDPLLEDLRLAAGVLAALLRK